MNITIFGASGKTGSLLLREALQQGHQVTAFARQALRITMRHPNLQIIEGSLKKTDDLYRVLAGRQAVISALGVSKTLHHDPDVVDGIGNIVKAMAKEDVTRMIYMSVFLANSQPDEFGFFARNILKRIIKNEVEDHVTKERLVCENVKNYTLVRPVRLTDGPFTGKFHHGASITSSEFLPSISRADVAYFMIRQLTDSTYRNKAVRVMKKIETS